MYPREKKKSSLYRRTVTPVFVLLIALVATFTITSSLIILNMQNRYTFSVTKQSMDYTFKSVSYQFERINNFLLQVAMNKDIENIMERNSSKIEDIVHDYFTLYTSIQNISLFPFKPDTEQGDLQIYYTFSVVVDQSNSLYQIANSKFTPHVGPGLYKNDMVRETAWYQALMEPGNFLVWWQDTIVDRRYIFCARRKTSSRDAETSGIIVVAFDTNNLSKIIKKDVQDEEGYFLLLDDEKNIVFSGNSELQNTNSTTENTLEYVSAIGEKSEENGTFIHRVRNNSSLVMYNTLHNNWMLAAVVPQSRARHYSIIIGSVGITAALLSILITSMILRKTSLRVAKPVQTLMDSMKRVETGNFDCAIPDDADIYEFDRLYKGHNQMLQKIGELIQDVYIKDIEKKQLQLDLLQSQINPHFLYNTLDIINCSALSIGANDISRTVKSLANVFRYGLNKGKDFISLENEIKQVCSYLDIQQIMNSNLRVEYTIPQELLGFQVINLMIQPLVENSILHGFKRRNNNSFIGITAFLENGTIIIEVYDNGAGVDAAQRNALLDNPTADSHGGYGIINVDKRIKLHFGQEYGIRYIPTDLGTRVRLSLPQRKCEM